MKAYGFKRRDMLTCRYGCCASKANRKADSRELVDSSRRKTARQDGKRGIFTDLIPS